VLKGQLKGILVHLKPRNWYMNGEDKRKNYKTWRGVNALPVHILQNGLT